MTKRLILMAGNIGAGKTSLTERIGEKLGWKTAFDLLQITHTCLIFTIT